MLEPLHALDLPPGFYHNGTVYQAKGRWYTGNMVRFVNNTVQAIGDWEEVVLTGSVPTGVCEQMITWSTSDNRWAAFGCRNGLYVVNLDSLVSYDITPAALTGAPYSWSLTTFGDYLIACMQFIGSTWEVSTFVWTGDVGAPAVATHATADGPSGIFNVVVTPERFLVGLRGWDFYADTPYHHRRVYWADQETYTGWDFDDATTTSGYFDLNSEGIPICGRPSRGQTLIWTTADLWVMTYIGGTLLYSFHQVGNHCGIIGPHAAVVIDTGAYWMGERAFYRYDGFVLPLPCEVHGYVFEDFNRDYSSMVWAQANPRFSEVTWHYTALSTDAIVPDRYVTYNYVENHWTFGELARTAGAPNLMQSADGYLLMIDEGATLYQHELDTPATDPTPTIESGPLELEGGDRTARVQRIVPDGAITGALQAYLFTAMYPEGTETENGPYTLNSPTSVRLTARQFRLKIVQVVADAWRLGVVRLGAKLGGRR
jgi:hypothetical protein